jgi:hypothetical protein
MHTRRGQFILSFLAIVLGVVLVLVGQGRGAVWQGGGGFFIAIGVGSLLLTLGSVVQGLPGQILRHPIFNAVVIFAVAVALVLTIYFAFVP